MTKVNEDQVRGGLEIDDIIKLISVHSKAGLPAVDGRRLTGLAQDIVTIKTGGDPELVFTKCGAVLFLRNSC